MSLFSSILLCTGSGLILFSVLHASIYDVTHFVHVTLVNI